MFYKSRISLKNSWKREFKRISERPVYFLGPALVMIFCSVFFLTLMEEGWPNTLPAGVVDLDQSALSRTLIRNLDATAQTKVVSHCSSYSEAREQMQKGEIYSFVVIPEGFERNLQSGLQPAATFYVNDTYLIPGSLSLKDLSFMGHLTGAKVKQNILEARGITEENLQMAAIQPVAIDAHLIGNPWANYGIYLINLLLPGVLQLMIIMITIFSIGMELKEKTGPDWIRTAGNSRIIALAGKILPYTLLFTLLGIAVNFLLYRYLQYPLWGSMWLMCFATFLYVIASQAVGIFFIGLLPVLRDAISLGAFYGLLGFTYAGFTFPVEAMPPSVQIFSWLFPIRYYFLIYGNIALNGSPFQNYFLWFIVLACFLLLPVLVLRRIGKAAVKPEYLTK